MLLALPGYFITFVFTKRMSLGGTGTSLPESTDPLETKSPSSTDVKGETENEEPLGSLMTVGKYFRLLLGGK